ncbi:dual oxidase maturation factor 1-like isoform X2 [Amphiura filiformis]|uniref:dual oxidase maturation factor 1-like isoform X2 n=1 Tax=Amphiura filiformis TaxID=82378 RepID=UPI003B2273F5
MGAPYSALRNEGYPAAYGPLKTAVTVDVLEIGFVTAFLIVIVSFIFIIPGIRGWQRLYASIRFFIGSYILVSIMLGLYGMEWEVAELHDTPTYYKAFETHEIEADIGVKIGLNAVNITLKADHHELKATEEVINYNERFHFYGGQGRIGFGRFSGRINREFREAQWLGKPYPILWIAEYFTLDGEDIRWGRSYRLAGYYTWIILWTAFPLYLISLILFFNVVRYGAYFLMATGVTMITGNIIYASVRFGSEMIIPFTDEKKLIFHKGASFYVCLVAGIVSVVCGLLVVLLDYFEPEKVSSFFNVDPLIDFEETFVYENEDEHGETPAMAMSDDAPPQVASRPQFKQRSKTKKTRRQPKPAPRYSQGQEAIAEEPEPETTDHGGMNGDSVKPVNGGSGAVQMSDLQLKEKAADEEAAPPAETEEAPKTE